MKEYTIVITHGDYEAAYIGTLHEFCTYYRCDAQTLDELISIIKDTDNADSVVQVDADGTTVKYIADLLGREREAEKFKTELDKMARKVRGDA